MNDQKPNEQAKTAMEQPQSNQNSGHHNPFWSYGYGIPRQQMMMSPGFGYAMQPTMGENGQIPIYPLLEQMVVLQGQNQQLIKMMMIGFATMISGCLSGGDEKVNKIAPNHNIIQQILPQLMNFSMGYGMQQMPMFPSPMINGSNMMPLAMPIPMAGCMF